MWVRVVVAMVLLLLPTVLQAQEKRIALLIGNRTYDASVGVLKNPHNDIAVVGEALTTQGFDVLAPIKDARRSAILGGVRELVRRLNTAGAGAIGFLYYSGHGAAEKDTNINYLIPVDAKEPGTTAFWDESLKLDDILRLLDGARSAAKFIVFDACRNELQLPTKDTSKGLVPVLEQRGMFIAYASAPGRTASDRGEKSGPYAQALATELGKPGADHLSLFQNVKEAVYSASGGAQQPWESNGLVRRVYLTGMPPSSAQPKAPVAPERSSEVAEAWDRTKGTTSIAALELFISSYKDTYYAGLARLQIDELKKQQVAVATPPKAPTPQSVPAVAVPPTPPPARCDGLEALVGNERRCLKPKDGFKDCDTCPEMVVVPPGEFTMRRGKGALASERKVGIDKSFAVGKFEVTRGEFAAFARETGFSTDNKCWTLEKYLEDRAGRSYLNPGFAQDDRHPVVCVSWDDAKAFTHWLSAKTSKTYRLPSDSEWEFVARAGSTTRFHFGDSELDICAYENVADQTAKGKLKFNSWEAPASCRDKFVYTAPVGSFKPNAFGVHDAQGNAQEWVEDCDWSKAIQGSATCSDRVIRGGSWWNLPAHLSPEERPVAYSPTYRNHWIGFRLARTLSP